MKKIAIKTIILSVFFGIAAAVSAQVNSLYYMKTVSTRHELNPAFQSLPNVYVDLPILPSFYVAGGENSLILHDVIFPKSINGEMQTVLFLHKDLDVGDKNKVYNQLKKNTNIFSEVQIDLLSFGFRTKEKHYFTFGISQKVSEAINVPKDLFKLALYGTPDTLNMNKFDLKKFGVNANVYSEIALGYSRNVDEQLTLGGKAKLLLGQANASAKSSNLILETSREKWIAHMNSEVKATIPYVDYTIDNEGKIDKTEFNEPDKTSDYFNLLTKPSGWGGALDLGASYYMLDNHLHLSASVLDLGFIHWKGSKSAKVAKLEAKGDMTYEGMNLNKLEGEDGVGDLLDELTQFADSISYTTSLGGSYNTWLPAKVMLGVEYGILSNKITFGLLSKSVIVNKSLYEEVTTSVNFLPVNWFNATLSYSWINGRFGNLGLGLGGRVGPFNMFIAADYIPLRYTPEYYPTHTQQFNVKGGFMLNFGYKDKKDDDKDGVINRKDKCPNTPFGYLVDKVGCPIDTDGDGVADNVDKCPDTPKGVAVDSVGCPLDTDGDNVPDYLDKCPNTPAGVQVDENGCPFDADKDGVPDYLDKCPNTPAGVQVDENGCPLDADKDGVPDYLDKCPNTPAGVQVDGNGCPPDTDGDGVPDYLDKCPGTPAAARGYVDENGCPKDTDGDGIPDYLDNCPTIPGVKSNKGCPEVKASVKKIFEKALQGIQFETGKDVIKSVSFPILNDIVKIMNENPTYLLQINGHTDNVGNPESNQILSEKRANSVKNYLINKGVSETRLTSQGFGDTQPVAPNTTAANKAKNRRVEFVVKFEETVPAE